MTTPEAILTFWYGDDRAETREVWFNGGPPFDAACRDFLQAWQAARDGVLADWRTAPESLFAYVILPDQSPRHSLREDGRGHATRAQALEAARQAVAAGWDKDMLLLERVFLYLPYEHAEDRAAQAESVRLFSGLGVDSYLQYAESHRAIIERFGRFPHRNKLLGRTDTPDEIAFMKEHGRGF